MAISQEASPARPSWLTPHTGAMQCSKVARLEHFVGRRGPEYRHRGDPGPFDPHRLNEEFDQLTIRFEPELHALWCMVNHPERPCFTSRLLDQIRTLQTPAAGPYAGIAEQGPAGAHHHLGLDFPRDLESRRRSRLVHPPHPRGRRSGPAQLCLCLRRCGIPEPEQDGASPVDDRAGSGRRLGRRVRACAHQ